MNFDPTKLSQEEKKTYDFCKSIGMTDEQYQEMKQKFELLNKKLIPI